MTTAMNPNGVTASELFTRTSIKIPSVLPGWNLDAWYYQPKLGRAPYPVVVMAHGLGSNKLMCLAAYAQAFASIGYACVVFDYRRWGASDGSPRHCLYITEQLDDYRTVVKYCRQQPELDPQRVVLWGTSLSGGHVATLATEKKLNLSAAIIQCPWLGVGVSPSLTSIPFLKLLAYGCLDVLKQAIGLSPLYIPNAAAPGQLGVLTTPDSPKLIKRLYEKSDFPNEISASSIFEMQMYKPVAHAAKVACPLLVVNADQDSICLLQGALDYAKACPSAEFVHIDCGHFDIYPRQPSHEQALDAQLEFLKRIVPV